MKAALVALGFSIGSLGLQPFLFEYSTNGGGGAGASRLEIDGSDASWIHEPAVAVVERGVIGVFRTTISTLEQQRLAELTPTQSTTGLRPDMPAVTVRLRTAGRNSVVALSPSDPAGSALVAEATRISERARQHPQRAIRIDLVQTAPFSVSIENVGVEPVQLDLDENALFIETVAAETESWSRLPSPPWTRAVRIAPGTHTEIGLDVAPGSTRARLARAILRLTASSSSIQGTASSRHVTIRLK